MTTNRIRFNQPLTREKAETVLREVAELTIERNTAKLAMDGEITAIKSKYDTDLVRLAAEIDQKVALLESWAASNPDQFPKDRKSIRMTAGVLGYRLGTPKLKKLVRHTWEAVLEKVKAVGRSEWLRVKEDLNKEQIISDYQQGIATSAELKAVGCEVDQDESFFVDPDLQSLETKTVQGVGA